MTTTSTNNFKINGLLNPTDSILDNLNTIATASGCWISFDAVNGLWSVIINQPAASEKSFNNSNIIGAVTISGTGISQLYNGVSVDFPHKDLTSQTDYIDLTVDQTLWYPHEETNNMQISFTCLNDPIQAQYIGMTELKQSRIDKIIQFTTDYGSLGLSAGDVIDITLEEYGFTNKKFRITRLEEDDAEDGQLLLKITAIEYDESIYDQTGLIRTTRTKKTGIIPKSLNTVVTQSDNNNTATQVNNSNNNLLPTNLYQLEDVSLGTLDNTSYKQYLKFDYNNSLWTNMGLDTYVDQFWYSSEWSLDGNMSYENLDPGFTPWDVSTSGIYILSCEFIFKSYLDGGTEPPLGVYRDAICRFTRNGSALNDGGLQYQSSYAKLNENVRVFTLINLTKGDLIDFTFSFKTNFSSGSYTVPGGYPAHTVNSNAWSSFAAIGTITHITNGTSVGGSYPYSGYTIV